MNYYFSWISITRRENSLYFSCSDSKTYIILYCTVPDFILFCSVYFCCACLVDPIGGQSPELEGPQQIPGKHAHVTLPFLFAHVPLSLLHTSHFKPPLKKRHRKIKFISCERDWKVGVKKLLHATNAPTLIYLCSVSIDCKIKMSVI